VPRVTRGGPGVYDFIEDSDATANPNGIASRSPG